MEEAGAEVPEQDVILAICGGLPMVYAHAISGLNKIPSRDLTLDYVVTELLSEEIQVATSVFGSLNLTSPPSTATGSSQARDEAMAIHTVQTCFFCNKPGHMKCACPEKA